jgi:hypothetical protein
MRPGPKPVALQRAAAELRSNPARSDRLVAAAAGVSHQTVREARHRLGGEALAGERVVRPSGAGVTN